MPFFLLRMKDDVPLHFGPEGRFFLRGFPGRLLAGQSGSSALEIGFGKVDG